MTGGAVPFEGHMAPTSSQSGFYPLILRATKTSLDFVNSFEIVLTKRSPTPRPLPQFGGKGHGEGAWECLCSFTAIRG
jgi:hypothetical protein